MDDAHADLGDVRLHYVAAGAGFPVVLLHGWPRRGLAQLLTSDLLFLDTTPPAG
jgi:pimeloyl-ACP methyl ester carboxylesterase